ncbi:MAG TPA: sigma-70 family RNA polymerase sigma factor [Dehalococcoidia bacterium]|nr:sigma-70 family RNA polymerase sigma factor [Dehalococcoidia bacterium]
MGLNFPFNRDGGDPAPQGRTLQALFGAHYPRLFAYTRCWAGDDAAGQIVVEAFCRAFARHPNASDEAFCLSLFATARRLCAAFAARGQPDDPLSPREREVLALLFEAQLSRGDIGRLLKMKEHAVNSALLRGLRKLRASVSPAAIAAYLRLA